MPRARHILRRKSASLPDSQRVIDFSFSSRSAIRTAHVKAVSSSVESIRNGKITGTINSHVDVLSSYKTDQRITFPESDITNWLILRPDGVEEGNYVGKFLDHYKPQ